MDFEFPAEQEELAASLERRLADDQAGGRTEGAEEYTPAWDALVELGVCALVVDEAYGGFGGRATDLYLVQQSLGRRRGVAPLWSTAVAAKAITWAGSDTQRRALLPAIANGELKIGLAFEERESRYELSPVGVTASFTDRSVDSTFVRVHGEKITVLFAEQVDSWLVSAQLDGQPRLMLVPKAMNGAQMRAYRTIDGLPAADLNFDGTPLRVELLPDLSCIGEGLLERLTDYGASLLCAEAVGLMEAAKDATLEHLKTRQQFGGALGRFQVLQHRMVDMLVHLEQARSLALLAVEHADSEVAHERARAVSAAKALVGEAARYVGQNSVQLHGAMGLTKECAVSWLLKRLTLIDLSLGDTDHHLIRFSRLARAQGQTSLPFAESA